MIVRRATTTAAMAILVLAGCSTDPRESNVFDPTETPMGQSGGVASEPSSGSSDSGQDASGGSSDDAPPSSSDDDEVKLDVAAPSGDPDGPGTCVGETCEGCTGVDLLFVIDNSVSMGTHQQALGEAFPAFADAIVDALPAGTSLHVAVTSTTMGHSSGGATTNCTASGDGGQPASAFYETPEVSNTGVNGAQGRLFEVQGKSYFEVSTDAPQAEIDALSAWFTSAANIGEIGSQVEMAAAGAGWAADPANAATNAGFIRDEGAVLVLFFIQDEPDQTPMSAAEDLVAKLEAAKAGCGGMDCVVGGGFVAKSCLPEVALGTLFDSFGAEPVVEELPFSGGDSSLFVPVLSETLAQVIAQTCEEIGPEG